MSENPTRADDALLPLLVAYDEGLAEGRTPDLAVPPELADDFGAAGAVLRLLNQAWPRTDPADVTVDESSSAPPAPKVPPAETGRVGRFRVLRELGAGGFGVVYLAHDPTLDRRVALKLPRSDRWGHPEFRRRFLQEGRAAALLDHPNIVRVLEADATESAGYIASSYCEGPSLAAWLRDRKGPAPVRLAAALAADLAAAVHHAHERGVIHRDLKPANILLEIGPETDAAGLPRAITPRICDFGLAKLLEGEQTETRPGVVMGTPQYMAPEQAEGRTKDVGPAADVYALGVILYELLTGRPPFVGEPGLDLLKRVATAAPERPRRLRKDVPRDLETIVLTCLEKEPGRRYATAAALETDLRRWLDGQAPLGRPEPAHRKAGRWARRHPAWAAAAALLAAVAAAACAAWPRLFPDPDRVVREKIGEIAAGKTVTLIGGSGGPAWSRWRAGGEKAAVEIAPQNVFRIHTGGLSLLELLPNPGCDHYRLRAEILHENVFSEGGVGLYVCGQEYLAARGTVQTFMDLEFDDIRDYWANALPVERARQKPPLLNPVRLCGGLWSDREAGLNWEDSRTLSNAYLFRSAGLAANQWRTLTVEVSPQEVRALWGNGDAVGAPRSTTELAGVFDALRGGDARRVAQAPAVFTAPGFAPRGGLGLYLRYGSASFRNVVLEPLGP